VSIRERLRGLREPEPSERLRKVCERFGTVRIADVEARQEVAVAGEITSLRIVPRAGSPSIEAAVNDGTGCVVAVWTGRRQIAGIAPGRRIEVRGRLNPGNGSDNRLYLYNPRYELIL